MSAAGDSQVNLSNWREAPYNRAAFHRVSEILPTAPVPGARAGDFGFAPSRLSLDGLQTTQADGSAIGLDGFLEATSTDAMVVLADGKLVHEYYAPGMPQDATHILMSSTKAITGLVAGGLASSGQVDFDDLATRYVPEVALTPYAGATLRHLLDMRCVLPFDASMQPAYYEAVGWAPATADAGRGGLHTFISNLQGPIAKHGGPFRYVSSNTDLLGWALERATGKPFAALASEGLWRPLGAEHDAQITLARDGAPMCAGGFSATARDFARLGQLIVDDGRRGGAQVLPEAVLADILQNGDRPSWANGEWGAFFAPVGQVMSYRSGWYTIDRSPQIQFAMGIHGQNLIVDRANRIVIAKLSSWPIPFDYGTFLLTHRTFDEMLRLLANPKA